MLLRKKVEGQALSIDQGTNIAYVSTTDDLSSVRRGSHLRLSGYGLFYIISSVQKVNLEEDFQAKERNCIFVDKSFSCQLQEQDVISLFFPEYELDIVSTILNPGNGYIIGDILEVPGGNAINDNTTSFVVKMINDNGAITKIGVNNRGKYSSPPNDEVVLAGGRGKGAKFEISFLQLKDSLELKNKIVAISSHESKTLIYLENNLPFNLTFGKFRVTKWSIELSVHFSLSSIKGVTYAITRDFTPVLNLPLLAPNSPAMDVSYNYTVNQLEQEIVLLRSRIDVLEKYLEKHLEKQLAGLNTSI